MANTPTWHHLSADDVLDHLKSSKEGLAVDRIEDLQQRHGPNALPTKKSDAWWTVLFRQFISPLILILIVAALISVALDEWVDVGVILAAVAVNTVIGFIQEYKASKALAHLKSLVQPHAVVLRGGAEVELLAAELVPGDVLVLQTGDRVTADARLVEGVELSVNEAALTGESMPIKKAVTLLEPGVPLAERTNMLYAGTSVVGGRGLAVVVATGVKTELGNIAKLVQETEETDTPLQEQLGRLARWLAWGVMGVVGFLFVAGVFTGRSTHEMLEMSVALAVAAIPEGLIVSVTIILAIGMQRILRRRSLVRRLVAAETLGSVSIICSDKTGTITEGEMRVTDFIGLKDGYRAKDLPAEKPAFVQQMLEVIALCNDASVVSADDGMVLKGSPTERALMQVVLDVKIDVPALTAEHPRSAEIPFDSAHKYMVTANGWPEGSQYLLKGAPGIVMESSDKIQLNGRPVKMTEAHREALESQIAKLTQKGLRLIATASRSHKGTVSDMGDHELEQYTFLGLVGLRDPLRAETKEQIQAAAEAGVRTIIITGDHPMTAQAIGAEAGLVVGPEGVIVGRVLDDWTDEELEKRVEDIHIYARVEPRHKIRIVKAWQSRGEVVAMTGDGVNDAPALKAADIGIAVGSGTEVAKQASDVVILDNNLGTITAAIEEGRVIFDNIRKTTVYLMADSFTEMVLIGGSIMMGLPIPLLPAQILWINLVADSFPNAGLTLEPGEKDIMKQPPRPRDEAVLNREMMTIIFLIGVVTDAVLFVLYLWLLGSIGDIETIRSILFAAVGIDSLLYIFAVKSFRKSIFRINPFSNLYLVGGVFIGFGLMLLALLHPFFQEIFEIVPLSLSHWILLLIIGVMKLVAIEIAKEVFLIRPKRT